jgi:hydrogenase small subunit
VSSQVAEYPAIWIAGGCCSGCSISLLNTVSPNIANLLLDPVLPGKHVNLRFHATIMTAQGEPAVQVFRETATQKPNEYLLLVEGAVPTAADGIFCTLGDVGGHHLTMLDTMLELAQNALAVISVGTCSSFGGIPSGAPNPTGAKSVREALAEAGISKPLINVPGCPPHPDWLVGTIASVLLTGLPAASDLDAAQRPKAFYGRLIHDNCPRRGFFDVGHFARHTSEPGCLYEIGCKGPMTYADCSIRRWNNGVNWCIGSGAPCIGCVEPGFPDKLQPMAIKMTTPDLERFKISAEKLRRTSGMEEPYAYTSHH